MATGDKSKATAGNKKRKGYLPQHKPVKKKGAYPLRPGVQGFFITCDGGREHQAAHEAINVIDSFFEELVLGKPSGVKSSGLPEKPSNKKITFSYSDDDDNDDNCNEEEEKGEGKAEGTEEAVKGEDKAEGNEEAEKGEGKAEGNEEAVKGEGKAECNEEAEKGEDRPEGNEETEKREDKTEGNEEAEKGEGEDENKGTEQNTEINVNYDGDHVEKQATDAEEPPTKKPCLEIKVSKPVSHNKTEEKSIDKLIEAELEELGDKSKRRFIKLDAGCNGLVFIQMRRKDGDPSPKDIVQHMMTSAAATRKHMSRFILRVVPVEASCYASEEEISRAIKPLVECHFPIETEVPHKFAVLYGARANTGIDRMKIITAVAKSVPGPHKVDLGNPDKTIIVEVVKTVCLIGVVEKYKELAKYNLRQLTSPKP